MCVQGRILSFFKKTDLDFSPMISVKTHHFSLFTIYSEYEWRLITHSEHKQRFIIYSEYK